MASKRQAEGQVRQDPGGHGLEFNLWCKRPLRRGEGGQGGVGASQVVPAVQAGDDVAADMERGSDSRCFGEEKITGLSRWNMEW